MWVLRPPGCVPHAVALPHSAFCMPATIFSCSACLTCMSYPCLAGTQRCGWCIRRWEPWRCIPNACSMVIVHLLHQPVDFLSSSLMTGLWYYPSNCRGSAGGVHRGRALLDGLEPAAGEPMHALDDPHAVPLLAATHAITLFFTSTHGVLMTLAAICMPRSCCATRFLPIY